MRWVSPAPATSSPGGTNPGRRWAPVLQRTAGTPSRPGDCELQEDPFAASTSSASAPSKGPSTTFRVAAPEAQRATMPSSVGSPAQGAAAPQVPGREGGVFRWAAVAGAGGGTSSSTSGGRVVSSAQLCVSSGCAVNVSGGSGSCAAPPAAHSTAPSSIPGALATGSAPVLPMTGTPSAAAPAPVTTMRPSGTPLGGNMVVAEPAPVSQEVSWLRPLAWQRSNVVGGSPPPSTGLQSPKAAAECAQPLGRRTVPSVLSDQRAGQGGSAQIERRVCESFGGSSSSTGMRSERPSLASLGGSTAPPSVAAFSEEASDALSRTSPPSRVYSAEELALARKQAQLISQVIRDTVEDVAQQFPPRPRSRALSTAETVASSSSGVGQPRHSSGQQQLMAANVRQKSASSRTPQEPAAPQQPSSGGSGRSGPPRDRLARRSSAPSQAAPSSTPSMAVGGQQPSNAPGCSVNAPSSPASRSSTPTSRPSGESPASARRHSHLSGHVRAGSLRTLSDSTQTPRSWTPRTGLRPASTTVGAREQQGRPKAATEGTIEATRDKVHSLDVPAAPRVQPPDNTPMKRRSSSAPRASPRDRSPTHPSAQSTTQAGNQRQGGLASSPRSSVSQRPTSPSLQQRLSTAMMAVDHGIAPGAADKWKALQIFHEGLPRSRARVERIDRVADPGRYSRFISDGESGNSSEEQGGNIFALDSCVVAFYSPSSAAQLHRITQMGFTSLDLEDVPGVGRGIPVTFRSNVAHQRAVASVSSAVSNANADAASECSSPKSSTGGTTAVGRTSSLDSQGNLTGASVNSSLRCLCMLLCAPGAIPGRESRRLSSAAAVGGGGVNDATRSGSSRPSLQPVVDEHVIQDPELLLLTHAVWYKEVSLEERVGTSAVRTGDGPIIATAPGRSMAVGGDTGDGCEGPCITHMSSDGQAASSSSSTAPQAAEHSNTRGGSGSSSVPVPQRPFDVDHRLALAERRRKLARQQKEYARVRDPLIRVALEGLRRVSVGTTTTVLLPSTSAEAESVVSLYLLGGGGSRVHRPPGVDPREALGGVVVQRIENQPLFSEYQAIALGGGASPAELLSSSGGTESSPRSCTQLPRYREDVVWHGTRLKRMDGEGASLATKLQSIAEQGFDPERCRKGAAAEGGIWVATSPLASFGHGCDGLVAFILCLAKTHFNEWVDATCARVLQRERVLPLYSLVHA